TGNVLPGSASEIRAPDAPVAEFLPTRCPSSAGTLSSERAAVHALTSDDLKLLARARAAANGEAFSGLYMGDRSGYPSPSEADLALCNMLAFWTGRDADQIDRLFRQSALMRPKWDERHGAQTYGEMTIAKALAGGAESYGDRREPTPVVEEMSVPSL